MPADPQHVKELFMVVSEAPAADRAAVLDRECAGDADLRKRVEALLNAHEEPNSFLNAPAEDGTGAYRPVHGLEIGQTFAGRFKLREELGEGGMGVVYVADQLEPVQRRVALKVIKTGGDSARVLARFEQERQALALMDHPNIAKVFDAGVSDTGQPYFVMELIKGVPLTKYCDEARLTPRQRLELFIPVCQAVQHAHQKGIIHRDLKPSNILVGLYDGRPVPKVIDFGVAKATGPRIGEHSVYTEVGTIIGTLEYMSPEQAELNNLDIDTRSDVYALGVILYELLTGTVPFTRKELQSSGFAEMLRIIKEQEPPKPSTRLSASRELPGVAAVRHTEPAKLSKLIRGDLDWITMKALEKDRSRRYETANGLALDVERYLTDEPVLAGPPSARYRLRKAVRRHKGPVLAAAAVVMALVGGMIGTGWGMIRAERARQEAVRAGEAEAVERQRAADGERKAVAAAAAEQRAAGAERAARRAADERTAETKAVLDFVQDHVFAAARPLGQDGGLGREVTLRRAVEVALPFVRTGFADRPLIEARLRQTLGVSFQYLGDTGNAVDQLDAARALFVRYRGPDHPDALTAALGLATGYDALGRYADAFKLREEAVTRARANLAPDDPVTLSAASGLANSYDIMGRYTDALKVREQALPLSKARLGPDHPDTLDVMQALGNSYAHLGRLADAARAFEQTAAVRKARLGPDHPETISSVHNLANMYARLGRLAEALKLHEDALARRRTVLGPDHPDTLQAVQNLATCLRDNGRLGDALKLREEALTLAKAKLGSDHPDTLRCMACLADSFVALGRLPDALTLHGEVYALRKAKLGADHPDTIGGMSDLATDYDLVGRYADALRLREEVYALRKAKLGPDHPATLSSMYNLALGYGQVGRAADALALREATLARAKAVLGPVHPLTLRTADGLASSYQIAGRQAEALQLREETLALQRAAVGPDHPATLISMHNLANSYAALGRQAEALALREDTLARRRPVLGPDHYDTLMSMNTLANSYHNLGRHAEALKLREETLARQRARLGPDHPDTLLTMHNLARGFRLVGRPTEALSLYQETATLRRARLGPSHPDTLDTSFAVAVTLAELGRTAEAVAAVDDCLGKAADGPGSPTLVPTMIEFRLRLGEKAGDVAACRKAAERWENLNRTDVGSLYNAGCFRAVAAAVGQTNPGADASRFADDDADRAMDWLRKAVAAGYKDAGHIKEDKDLGVLRGRDDFKKLLANLEVKSATRK